MVSEVEPWFRSEFHTSTTLSVTFVGLKTIFQMSQVLNRSSHKASINSIASFAVNLSLMIKRTAKGAKVNFESFFLYGLPKLFASFAVNLFSHDLGETFTSAQFQHALWV